MPGVAGGDQVLVDPRVVDVDVGDDAAVTITAGDVEGYCPAGDESGERGFGFPAVAGLAGSALKVASRGCCGL